MRELTHGERKAHPLWPRTRPFPFSSEEGVAPASFAGKVGLSGQLNLGMGLETEAL